jgi:hypothetical protein
MAWGWDTERVVAEGRGSQQDTIPATETTSTAIGTLFLVGREIHQIAESRLIIYLDLGDPTSAIGVAPQAIELVRQFAVGGNDVSIDGAVKVAHRLNRFDFPNGFAHLDDTTDVGQFHKHQIGELFDRKCRNADRDDFSIPSSIPFSIIVIRDVDPFVCFCVQKLIWFHELQSPLNRRI